MIRREFLTLLGGAAVAWPLAAGAEQVERMRRVGVLNSLAEQDLESVARNTVFEQALQALNWNIGRNLLIDYRWSAGDPVASRKLAAELAALKPDVILVSGNVVIAPMMQAAPTIPIIFVQVIDPVGSGFVERAWRSPAGTSPALPSLNTASPANGSNC
jgi:putative tryptophan/tyrosine transport system substrate-binding protein